MSKRSPSYLSSVTTLTTPATASAPYTAAAPSRKTSIRRVAPTGSELVFAVCTGTKFSVCVPGVKIMRRPLTRTNVLPVPTLRRLIEALSPRASLRLPVVRASWNCTSPACGIERNRSSPETLPVAAMRSSLSTETGSVSAIFEPSMRLPTTTIASVDSASASGWLAVCANDGVATMMEQPINKPARIEILDTVNCLPLPPPCGLCIYARIAPNPNIDKP